MLRSFKKHDPFIYVNNTSKHRFKSYHKTIKTYSNWINFLPSTLFFTYKCRAILKQLKSAHKDVCIYLPAFHFWNYIIARNAKKLNIPCFGTVHDYKTHSGEKNYLVEWVQHKTIQLLSKVIFLTKSQSTLAISNGIKKENIIHLAHPLFEIKTKNNLSFNSSPNLLFLGRIKAYKGVDLLLKACANLKFNKLTIAGEGSLPIINDEKVTVINERIPEKLMNKLLDSHELLILPYEEATQSGILSLGLSKEVVMVITKHEGLQEQISDKSCYWSEPSFVELQSTLKLAISDKEKYESFKKNLLLEKNEFSERWQNDFDQFIKLISTIHSSGSGTY